VQCGTRKISDEVKCPKDIFETPHSMAKMENVVEPALTARSAGKVMTLKGLGFLVRDAFFQWIDDNPFQMGAALAYYTLFSIAPLLLIAIAVAGSVFGRDASQVQIIGAIQDVVGFHSARAILAIIENAGQRPDSGFFATAAGMILLLLGAAGVIGQLQDSLNAIWRVASKTGHHGVRTGPLGLVLHGSRRGIFISRLTDFQRALNRGFGNSQRLFAHRRYYGAHSRPDRLICVYRIALRGHLQIRAGRPNCMERCLGRSGHGFIAIFGRKICYRLLSRPEHGHVHLRRGRFPRYSLVVGLLLISHVFFRRRVDPSLCKPVRIEGHIRRLMPTRRSSRAGSAPGMRH
jgi:hypothetical protein